MTSIELSPEAIEAIAAALAKKLSATSTDKLWTADDVAEYLSVCRRQVVNRYAKLPDFPAPIQLPTPTGRGELRWPRKSIIEWAEGGSRGKKLKRAA